MVVRAKDADRPNSLALLDPTEPGPWAWRIARLSVKLQPFVGKVRGAGRLAYLLWNIPRRLEQAAVRRRRQRCRELGHEDFEYPATWNLLNRLPFKPDILHLHNLHGGYLDLRALPWLTRRFPTVLTLHDMWLLTGHCAHSMGCERWRSGCGQCPDLTLYPALENDGTAHNWERKRRIFARSRMHVVGVSRWVLDLAEQSILKPAMLSSRVIHNGIDVELFSPGEKPRARHDLGLPPEASVLVFSATRFRTKRHKDWPTVYAAARLLGERHLGRPVILVGIGDEGKTERGDGYEVRYAGWIQDQKLLATYYRAADICVHAAHGESFCVAIAEARACGAPTIATAVDGIPEQIRSLTDRYTPCPVYDTDEATGILVGAGDPQAMADACAMLLTDETLLARLSANAARDARDRFSNERMVREYLALYEEALESCRTRGGR